MELQVLRPAVLNSTLTSAGWCLPIIPWIELKLIGIGSMTATTVVDLVHDGFDFQVESAQIVAEGGKDTDEHQAWQVKWELDNFIEGLLASVAICSELVRWLQDHEDQAECAKETYGKERSEEESFEFEALQCQGFLF